MKLTQCLRDSSALLLFLSKLTHAQTAAIDDLFTIATTGGGACSTDQQDSLAAWWTDVYEMLEAAQSANKNYATDQSARLLFLNYFGVAWDEADQTTVATGSQDQMTSVMAVFNNMLNFMNTGQIDFGDVISNYWIYCNSLFLEYQSWSTPAKDASGNEVEDDNGNPILLEDIESYQSYLQDGFYPFWYGTPGPNDYMFLDRTKTYCSVSGSLGVTTEDFEPYSITICPTVFSTSPDTTADAKPSLNTKIDNLMTASSTLLHEMVHALLTNEATPDHAYGTALCQNLAKGNTISETVENPDSYAFFAMAYKYRLTNWGTDSEPIYYDFSFPKVAKGSAPP